MAGGKETPRQKMIGMMYLVLTALLALNVSSAILLKFQFIDESLMEVNRNTVSDNSNVVKSIASSVAKAGNRPADAKVVEQADQVRKQTAEMVSYLRGLRDELEKASGGKDAETGNYINPEANEIVNEVMIGGTKKGKGYELEQKLNGYASFLRQFNTGVPERIAMSGAQDPRVKNNQDQRKKDFAQLNFEETPMVAALATLAQKESEVLKYEAETLSQLAQKVGADIIKFENIFAMASAESKTVAAGTKYKAEMFLAASSDAVSPTMSVDGRSIPVKAGKGQIEFTATAGNYDAEGNAKKTWKGQVRFRQPSGKDTVFTVTQEYVVAKPVMQIQSASINSLYFNCGNELSVQVPALGATYDPAFSASGATVVKGAKKGFLTIIPTSRQVKLNVSSGGNSIGSQDFTVKLVPRPQVVAYANGRPVDIVKGMAAPGPRVLEIRAIADESFKNQLPKDARYRVTEYVVYLVRGNRPAGQVPGNGPTVNISSLAAQARPGDRLAIDVREVRRMNFRDQQEVVPSDGSSISIQLN
ncbi:MULTISPECIES: gliding motility protein GldM [Rufibacter]|uniref:Gliding motility-associated protein GldM n=1 Tax=Rufibacter quisquiliarum TaxID=1549639 RepID=A0A839GF58_9BACT|nr:MULTISPECIES: gliding motility protein GldM [Rufibacter]MBA9076183.1 gliding motility-associated protein GldM [Rufibacter quisquiliarum]